MPSYVIPPAGITAASFFTPVFVDPARPPVIMADDIDPQTRELRSLFRGAHPVDAALQANFTARRNAGPALSTVGHDFLLNKKNVEGTTQALKNECKRLTQRHVDANNIEVEEVFTDADTYPDMGVVVVKYRNLRTGQRGEVRR
jgi:hypothetical protein